MITKAVILAADLGTRLLSARKERPKEMLPIFFKLDYLNSRHEKLERMLGEIS